MHHNPPRAQRFAMCSRPFGEHDATAGSYRVICLIDADSFYCAVHARADPTLRGKPFAVCQRQSCACVSYEARARQLRNRCSVSEARAVGVRLVQCDMELIRAATAELESVLSQFGAVEMASCDEGYLDLTSASIAQGCSVLHGSTADSKHDRRIRSEHERLLAAGSAIAANIKAAVLTQTALTVSAAVAPNKLLAKLVVSANKPDGLTVMFPSMVASMLWDLPLSAIPYIGVKTCVNLQAAKLETCDQVQQLRSWQDQLYDDSPPHQLVKLVGAATADYVWCAAQGVDDSSVAPAQPPKSISVDLCCRPDPGYHPCTERAQLHVIVRQATELLVGRLEDHQNPNKLTVKWRWFNKPLSCVSRSCSMTQFDSDSVYVAACKLLAVHCPEPFELSRIILSGSLPQRAATKVSTNAKSAKLMSQWLLPPTGDHNKRNRAE